MPVTRDMLLSELKELQRLTAFEQVVATVRRAQAASTDVSQELAANARKSAERLALLGQAVRGVGGTPDLVGPVLGRLGAVVQTQVNQVQTLQGALLGDLALEHQLRERARYARTLAVSLGEGSVVPVLDRLDAAHTETISWLERRLSEVGRSGTSALKATPVQVAVGTVRKAALAPLVLAGEGVNRVGALVDRLVRRTPEALAQVEETVGGAVDEVADLAGRATQQAAEQVAAAADTAEDVAERTVDAVIAGADSVAGTASSAVDTVASAAGTVADTASSAAGTVADTATSAAGTVADTATAAPGTVADTATSAAGTVADTASSAADELDRAAAELATGTASDEAVESAAGEPVDAATAAADATEDALAVSGGTDVSDAKPPFAGYERLTGDTVMRHVADTDDVAELRTLLAFEQAHKARKGVLKAAQGRLQELSASA